MNYIANLRRSNHMPTADVTHEYVKVNAMQNFMTNHSPKKLYITILLNSDAAELAVHKQYMRSTHLHIIIKQQIVTV